MLQGRLKLNGFKIPLELVEAFGPFEEFKPDASIENQATLPFAIEEIECIEQTPDNLHIRTTSKCPFFTA